MIESEVNTPKKQLIYLIFVGIGGFFLCGCTYFFNFRDINASANKTVERSNSKIMDDSDDDKTLLKDSPSTQS